MPATSHAADRGQQQVQVDTGTGQRLLDANDIQWIGADDAFSAIHAGGARYRVRDSLAQLERVLDPAHFMRIHRSAIIRLDQVREVRVNDALGEGGAVVLLRDGTRLPVSRRRLSRLKALLRPWTRT
jgi:two-component system LytT family response regulator